MKEYPARSPHTSAQAIMSMPTRQWMMHGEHSRRIYRIIKPRNEKKDNNMPCEKCSTELPDDAVACYRCGTLTGQTYYAAPPKATGRGRLLLWIAATLGIAVLAAGVVAIIASLLAGNVVRNNEGPKGFPDLPGSTRNSPSPPDRPLMPEKQRTLMVNEQFPVPTGNYNTLTSRLTVQA